MAVSAFLGQVDIGLIPYKEFMTAISGTEFGGICLVTVTKHYPMETTAYQHGYRSVRTVVGPSVVTRTDGFIVKNGFLSRILYPPVK